MQDEEEVVGLLQPLEQEGCNTLRVEAAGLLSRTQVSQFHSAEGQRQDLANLRQQLVQRRVVGQGYWGGYQLLQVCLELPTECVVHTEQHLHGYFCYQLGWYMYMYMYVTFPCQLYID